MALSSSPYVECAFRVETLHLEDTGDLVGYVLYATDVDGQWRIVDNKMRATHEPSNEVINGLLNQVLEYIYGVI